MEGQQSLKSENLQKKEIRTRQRASLSCTECRRRKQKCNQTRNTACNNCARRYPPVPCVYDSFRTLSKYKESIIDLTVIETKLEDSESEEFEFLSPSLDPESPLEPIIHYELQQFQHSGHHSLSPPDRNNFSGLRHASLICDAADGDSIRDEDTSDREVEFAILSGQYHPYPEYQGTCEYVLDVGGGGVAMNPLKFLPIEPTLKNASLFNFFARRLSPYISSIDGSSPSDLFTSQWLSFMAQSPIAINVAILSAAYFQATTRSIDVEKSVDAISSKGKLITLINEHIREHVNSVHDESIAAVMSLASTELIYSDQRSTVAHMRGLRDMVDTRGGIRSIQFDPLQKMLLRTDYQIATTYECETVLDVSNRECLIPILASFPLELDNPILHSHIPFVDTIIVLNISIEAARILDDARSLTISVLALAEDDIPPSSRDQILSMIHCIHQRLNSSPAVSPTSAQDFLYQACRSTAIIYSSAIITRTPLSLACTPELLQQLWVTMWRVPLQRWKQIPGIFLWILLVANPFARDKPEGRFFKALTPATIMAMGLVDWDTVMVALKGFVAIQRWLGGNLRGMILPTRRLAASRTPENGFPAWTMAEEHFSTIS